MESIFQGSQTQIAPRVKLGPMKQPEGCSMTRMQQWRYLNFTRNSFYILFPAKCIVSQARIPEGRRLSGTMPSQNFCSPQILLCPEKLVLNI